MDQLINIIVNDIKNENDYLKSLIKNIPIITNIGDNKFTLRKNVSGKRFQKS